MAYKWCIHLSIDFVQLPGLEASSWNGDSVWWNKPTLWFHSGSCVKTRQKEVVGPKWCLVGSEGLAGVEALCRLRFPVYWWLYFWPVCFWGWSRVPLLCFTRLFESTDAAAQDRLEAKHWGRHRHTDDNNNLLYKFLFFFLHSWFVVWLHRGRVCRF